MKQSLALLRDFNFEESLASRELALTLPVTLFQVRLSRQSFKHFFSSYDFDVNNHILKKVKLS